MCYSKEVSFAAGSLMTCGILYAWWVFVRHQLESVRVGVYRNILIGFSGVAIHQFADALSIATGSEAIYRLGLIASISCMYFYMRSLEKLSHFSFGSRAFAFLIAVCAIQIFATDFLFENQHFWVRGDGKEAYLLWSGMWLALFVYWNVCLFYYRKVNASPINRRLLIDYGLYSINLSYILYSVYAYFSLFMNDRTINGWNVFSGFDLLKDSPSVWCTFSVIQAFLIPLLFKKMNAHYHWDAHVSVPRLNERTIIHLVGVSIFIWLILFIGFPLFFGAAAKMVTT